MINRKIINKKIINNIKQYAYFSYTINKKNKRTLEYYKAY